MQSYARTEFCVLRSTILGWIFCFSICKIAESLRDGLFICLVGQIGIIAFMQLEYPAGSLIRRWRINFEFLIFNCFRR